MTNNNYSSIEKLIVEQATLFLKSKGAANIQMQENWLSPTKKEHTGDFTITLFGLAKTLQLNPESLAHDLGSYLIENNQFFKSFNVIKGFLNLEVSSKVWVETLMTKCADPNFGVFAPSGKKILVEFCSPNTNKPLHLGHLRNILLGWSISKILEANGHQIKKVQIINDRGIAICKSMLAWQLFGNNIIPNEKLKGDHLVGNMYVLFEQKFQEDYKLWQLSDVGKNICEQNIKSSENEPDFFTRFKNDYFNDYSSLGIQAKKMLQDWENGNEKVLDLWKQMNQWVYTGFDQTFESLGVTFDALYFESETYLLGKDLIEKGLKDQVFYKKEDGSVWVDLTDRKLDHKILLRSDGTSVYITQDLGTAHIRNEQWQADQMIYVVADEQNYHFQVLFETLKKMNEPYADGLFHLSYGMVELPSGRMKSREGNVVDTDELIAEIQAEVTKNTSERPEMTNLSDEDKSIIVEKIALGAIKYFILKVNARKKMIFDTEESVDLQGNTGPYIQNAFVRIQSVLRKHGRQPHQQPNLSDYPMNEDEIDLVKNIYLYPHAVKQASLEMDPSVIANFAYTLAKSFHKFYHNNSILLAENVETVDFRVLLSNTCGLVLEKSMKLLGIEMPERM